MDTRPATLPDADACYLALKTRDARFDGRFFTGVTSTGIYCRPVCSVRTPRRENCRFFDHAARAESEGFRPCLRCRPELAPHLLVWSIQDASSILARQAARMLDEPDAWAGSVDGLTVQALATRLGVSDRHLRRIFEARLGVSPLQYLQTRRLLAAKQLLADTRLPITQVALASGFASVRRFNAAFAAHYRLSPTALRRNGSDKATAAPSTGSGDSGIVVRLGYRPPYDIAAMCAFFAQRQLQGVEAVDTASQQPGIARTLRITTRAGQVFAGWLDMRFQPARHQLELRVGQALCAVLPLVVRRVRNALDLDADPQAIQEVLGSHFPGTEGMRVPGALDGFELAVRAVMGQQVTVAAARTLTQRLVRGFGEPIDTPHAGLTHLFPTAATLAGADPDALGALGIVKQRQRAIQALARATADGALELHAGSDVAATVRALKELPGIGDWTAQYIAMRALRWPDAFPAGDVALHNALGVRAHPQAAREAEARSQAWRPWRSYAVLRAWSLL